MTTEERLDAVLDKLRHIEERLKDLTEARTRREWYTVEEAAALLHRRPFTVREWCRLRRVRADKRTSGRGLSREWRIHHDELVRIQNEGLIPVDDSLNGDRGRRW